MHDFILRERMHSIDLQYEDGGADQYYLITRESLAEVDALQRCGGIDNIVSALRTNLDVGILGDQRDLHLRRQAFGSNFTPQRRCRSPHTVKYIKHLLSHALRDTTILLLLCCAMLSLAIGVRTNGAAELIIDGALVLLPISFLVCFGAIIRFIRARWTVNKSSMKLNNKIWVVRNGTVYEILESELVVGDIVCLQAGDRVPADGLFIDGDSFGFDKTHPSLFTGCKVDKGQCRMLVTSVGENTERSRLIRSIDMISQTPLLDSIEKANSKLERIWLGLSLILLSVQFVRCFMMSPAQADKDSRSLDPKGVKNTMEDLMKESIHLIQKERLKANYSLVTMLCVLLFASRDGLPLAVFISLLYGSSRMKSAHAIIQKIQASAAVGLITTICTCETADLTLHHSRMAELWIGFDLVHDHLNGEVDRRILDALREGILVHSPPDGCLEEISLLTWARAVLGCNMDQFLLDSSIVRYQDNDLCCSIVKTENEADEGMHVHWKGAPHLILSMCSHYYTVDGEIETLDATKTAAFLQIVSNLVGCSLAFAYKREVQEEEEEEEEDLESDLTLLGFVSLKNPYSPQLIEAIADCQSSGVEIKLFVDADKTTARIMAVNSGLVRREDDGAVVEAVDFRSSSKADRVKMADSIQVMANASPADKLEMVQCLRQKRHVVAAAAAAIRDSPLLKEADVGLFMGGAGEQTEASKEDGDIMIPSSEFSQIPGIVNLGRRVCRNLEKLVQLQLTMEISAFTINMISLAATRKEAVSSFQVVWVYLIVGILGGVGVAITTIVDTCSSEAPNVDPVYGSGRVVSRGMCRSIALQSLFQVGVVLIMVLKGKTIFHVKESELQTMVFNCYAFCQVFLLIPAMELKRNDAVAGIFLGVVAAVGILQVAMVEIMGVVSHRAKLDLKQWCVCIGIASFSLLLNCICCKFHGIFMSRIFIYMCV